MDTIQQLQDIMRNCRHGGPRAEDTPEFQAFMRFAHNQTTPLDSLSESSHDSYSSSSAQIIHFAAQTSLHMFENDPSFFLVRGTPKSCRYMGALAVDAWLNNDITYTQKFLIKAVFLEALQHQGHEAVSHPDTPLVHQIQQILQHGDLQNILLRVTRGACLCVTTSKAIRDAFQLDSHDDDDDDVAAVAARKQQEIDQLPPVLKPDSKFWTLKTTAASHLQAWRLNLAREFYTDALQLVDKGLTHAHTEERLDWTRKLANEKGRIESNLSLIFLRQKDLGNALFYADMAVADFPTWSKPHCRRALALEALGRLEEAEAAACKALDVSEGDVTVDSYKNNAQEEYRQIQQRMEVALEAQQPSSSEDHDIRKMQIDPSDANVGSLNAVFAAGLVECITTYLLPVDVAKLEQTCRGFAAQPEPRRRLALSSPLWNVDGVMEECIHTYCSTKLDDPATALRELVAATLVRAGPSSSDHELPGWLRKMIEIASPRYCRIIQTAFCMHSSTSVRQKIACSQEYVFRSSFMAYLCDANLETEDLLSIYREDCDSEALRLVTLLPSFEEEITDEFLSDLRDSMYVCTSNFLCEGERIRNQGHLQRDRMETTMSKMLQGFCTMFNKCSPCKWPCQKPFENEWNYTSDDINQYWSNSHPLVFRRWKSAIAEMLQWINEYERKNVIRFLAIQQTSLIANLPHSSGSVFVNSNSFGTFLMKECILYGGARALEMSLVTPRDFAELIADFYTMIRLYCGAFPRISEWRDQTVARHNLAFG